MDNFDLKKYLSEGKLHEEVDESNYDDTIEKSIKAIVTYSTLPPQIDYRKPYKIKAEKAQEYLESLPNGEQYIKQAEDQIEDYYNSGYAELDAKF
jgi:hypothetical protein